MKQCRKSCVPAMKKYYETVPIIIIIIIIIIILWKSTLSPQSGTLNWASVCCGGGGSVHSVFKRPVDFPPTVVTIQIRYCTVYKIIRKKIWCNGTALECNAEDRRFDPARDYFYFCLRRATHLLSNVALGYALYSTISPSFPFTPTMVQVPN